MIHEPLYLPLPPLRPRILNLRLLLIYAASVAIGAALAFTIPTRIPTASIITIVIFVAVLMSASLAVQTRVTHLRDSRLVNLLRSKASLQTPASAGLLALIEGLARRRPLFAKRDQSLWPWSAWEAQRRGGNLPHRSTIVTCALAQELQSIAPVQYALEPEFILPSAPQTFRFSIFISALFGLQALLAYGSGSSFRAILFLAVAVSFLMMIPQVRNALGLRFERQAPLVGMGVIESRDGKRWSVADSMMIVWAREPGAPVFAYLSGPAGWLMLTFANAQDEDFRNLWLRWTHPQPRPDLQLQA